MTATVRTKSVASLALADRRDRRTQHPSSAARDPGARRLKIMTPGRWMDEGGATPSPVMATVTDEIAMALAQLVRDRWAAEKREIDVGRSRLRVMVMRQG
jgi:hypothetical protein